MDTRIDQIAVGLLDPSDRAAVHALLRGHNLPLQGFDDPHVVRFVAKSGDRVVGSAAVEIHGAYGLLRSVAVADDYRGRSVGSRLTREAMAAAKERRLTAVYLLTETAAGFFPRFGFVPVSRAEIPQAVQRSVEFTTACPASAAAFAASVD